MESESRKRMGNWLYKAFTIGMLVIGGLYLNHIQTVVNAINSDRVHNEFIIEKLESKIKVLENKIDTLNKMHPWNKGSRKWSANVCKDGTFLGFLLYTPVDTSLAPCFKAALASYQGPQVKVNSLKRGWNRSSDHFNGKAADFEFSGELINYLVSDEGKKWLKDHGLMFYIEGRPGSRKVAKYLDNAATREYVFFNPKATGDHIHVAVT